MSKENDPREFIIQGEIDEMVIELVKQEYNKAEKLLSDNMDKLHELAKYLYEKETITGEEFMKILNNKMLDLVL